jgi:hypothetical protein
MNDRRRKPDDRERLLHGPYRAPPLRVGDRAACLRRDCDVKITGWTDAPLPWPQGVPVGGRSAPSILLDDELARAVRLESAAAIRYWWGVSAGVVWRWRKALGVGRTDSPGSRRLVLAASAKGADAVRGPGPTPRQVERRRLWRESNIAPRWPAADLALLGGLPDDEVARRTGRSWNAVRQKREALGVPNPAPACRRWTPADDALVRSLPREEAARRTGRSVGAISQRRIALGMAHGRPER